MLHVSGRHVSARRSPIVSRIALCALALVAVGLPGCGTLRDRIANRTPEASSNVAGERVLADLARNAEQPEPSARRPALWNDDGPLVPVTFQEFGEDVEATPLANAMHGDPRAFERVRPPIDGSVHLTAQQLPPPRPGPGPRQGPPPPPPGPGFRPGRGPAPALATSPLLDPEGVARPGERRQLRIPARGEGEEPRVDITSHDDRISMVVREAPIGTVLALIAQQQGLNVITSEDIPTPVTVTLQDVRLDDALDTLLTIAGFTWVRRNDILVVSRISGANKLAPHLQGREVRVLPLSYVAAIDVEKVVTGLLSPIGSVKIIESSSVDKRRTEESIVVEDLPGYLGRVESYVAQIDQPPRQVLIEAHVLQVELDDSCRHGVNFNYLSQIAGTNISLSTTGFANNAGSGPAFSLGLTNDNLDSLIEALKFTNDAKTLASPKVLVVNGQEARIQIGESLGYFVTTTTETSTLQNVDFLDLGIVLTVTPVISRDGQVLMTVKPEVSSGQINTVTGLPEEDTTQVESTVLLGDGQAMIIGGLIKEEDTDRQTRIIGLGTLWGIGRLFTRRAALRRRQEVIVALVPRIVPIYGPAACREREQVDRATTPLLTPDLHEEFRPWEPQPKDAIRNPTVPWRR